MIRYQKDQDKQLRIGIQNSMNRSIDNQKSKNKWQSVEFREIATTSGQKFDPRKERSILPCIELEHLKSGTSALLGTVDVNQQLSIKNAFVNGDVLFGKLRPYLRKYYYANFNGVCSTEIWVLKKSSITDSKFLFYLVQTERFISFANVTSGSKMPRADWSFLQTVIFELPPLPEQKRIVAVLETWDQAIEKLEKKIELKKNVKKGLMQQLLTGKKRLKGFQRKWRRKILGECLIIKHGKSQKHVESPLGKYPILGTGGEFGRSKKYLYNKPSVLIGRKGTIDKPRFIDQPFWTVDTLFYSEIIKPNNPKFVYYLFLTINWKRYNEGSGVPSLSASTISSIKVYIPDNEKEQIELARMFTCKDEELSKLKSKLSLVKDQKKYLLNKLVIGEIRTPEDLTIFADSDEKEV